MILHIVQRHSSPFDSGLPQTMQQRGNNKDKNEWSQSFIKRSVCFIIVARINKQTVSPTSPTGEPPPTAPETTDAGTRSLQ